MSLHNHDHPHAPPQPDDPEPALESRLLEEALRCLLMEKGIFSASDLAAAMEAMDARGEALGARIVARAWMDPAYRSMLMHRPAQAIKAFGIDMGVNELCVVENTPSVHNVIVCTLCSCYPRMILGVPPAWYKSREYRSRMVREPRAVLAEFGTLLDPGVEVRVHDSNADLRYLVLPMRPNGTELWTEERLASLVSRDSMIGVTPARAVSDDAP
jgi:nitrile hydratase